MRRGDQAFPEAATEWRLARGTHAHDGGRGRVSVIGSGLGGRPRRQTSAVWPAPRIRSARSSWRTSWRPAPRCAPGWTSCAGSWAGCGCPPRTPPTGRGPAGVGRCAAVCGRPAAAVTERAVSRRWPAVSRCDLPAGPAAARSTSAPDGELAAEVLGRIRPWLPPLLALTANSPIGRHRHRVGQLPLSPPARWPTFRPPGVWDGAERTTRVRALVAGRRLATPPSTSWPGSRPATPPSRSGSPTPASPSRTRSVRRRRAGVVASLRGCPARITGAGAERRGRARLLTPLTAGCGSKARLPTR